MYLINKCLLVKKTYLLLTILFIITFNFVSAQNVARSAKYKDLCGKWFYDYHNTTDDVLAYVKKQDHTKRFGNYINFKSSRELMVGKSAQCGNDQSIFRNYGIWEIDYKTDILNTSIEILKSGKRFKVIKMTPKALWLKKM